MWIAFLIHLYFTEFKLIQKLQLECHNSIYSYSMIQFTMIDAQFIVLTQAGLLQILQVNTYTGSVLIEDWFVADQSNIVLGLMQRRAELHSFNWCCVPNL